MPLSTMQSQEEVTDDEITAILLEVADEDIGRLHLRARLVSNPNTPRAVRASITDDIIREALRTNTISVSDLFKDQELLREAEKTARELVPGFSLADLKEYLDATGRSVEAKRLMLKEAALKHLIDTNELAVADLHDRDMLNIAIALLKRDKPNLELATNIVHELIHGCYAVALKQVYEQLLAQREERGAQPPESEDH